MQLRDLELERYLFGTGIDKLEAKEKKRIAELLQREMTEIFYSKNIF